MRRQTKNSKQQQVVTEMNRCQVLSDKNLISALSRFMCCFAFILLASCAGEIKQDADAPPTKTEVEYVDVDSEVEEDFSRKRIR